MKVNFLVRAKNEVFWVTFIPAVLVLIQAIAAVFGFSLDLSALGDKLVAVVVALFAVLTLLGVVVDPTTEGVGDTKLALSYTKPKGAADSENEYEIIRAIQEDGYAAMIGEDDEDGKDI